MAYRSLREFLDRLEGAGELVRVKERVDPVLEMAALADRAAKQGGPALLFENPATGAFPVAMNLFGTRRRTSWALSADESRGPRARAARPPQDRAAPDVLGEAEDAPEAREARRDGPEARLLRSVAGGGGPRARPREAPGAHDLAARRRPVRHAPAGHHPRSGDGHPERRDVPAPGPRPPPARHALAAPQDRDRALPRVPAARRADAGRDRARRRSRPHLLRLRPAPARTWTSTSSPASCAARRSGW